MKRRLCARLCTPLFPFLLMCGLCPAAAAGSSLRVCNDEATSCLSFGIVAPLRMRHAGLVALAALWLVLWAALQSYL